MSERIKNDTLPLGQDVWDPRFIYCVSRFRTQKRFGFSAFSLRDWLRKDKD